MYAPRHSLGDHSEPRLNTVEADPGDDANGLRSVRPDGRFHSTLNTGKGPMQLFVVYSPAGPELGLRELPDFRIIPKG